MCEGTLRFAVNHTKCWRPSWKKDLLVKGWLRKRGFTNIITSPGSAETYTYIWNMLIWWSRFETWKKGEGKAQISRVLSWFFFFWWTLAPPDSWGFLSTYSWNARRTILFSWYYQNVTFLCFIASWRLFLEQTSAVHITKHLVLRLYPQFRFARLPYWWHDKADSIHHFRCFYYLRASLEWKIKNTWKVQSVSL